MFAFSGTARASEVNVAEFTVGNVTVWAIADAIIEMNAGLFPDADPQAIAQYMPDGAAPASVAVFLVKTGDEVILIDTGFGNQSLFDGLEHIGVTPEQVTLILLTHMHRDHIGGLVRDGAKAFPHAGVLSSRYEHDFWNDERSAELFPALSDSLEMAREMIALYGPSVETFEFDEMVVPGIRALDARPHTPGHTLFMLESEGERMLFFGDTLHAAALQFPRPDINAQFDMGPEAADTRIRILEMAADENLAIAGAHLPFPAVGYVERRAEGGFTFITR